MLAHRSTAAAAVLGAALALTLPLAPAHAQFGKILKKAAEKVVVDKAVDKAAEKVGGGNDSTAATAGTTTTPAANTGAAPARGGRRAAPAPAVAAATGTTEELISKAIAYDAAFVAAFNNVLDTDPRFASFKAARTTYDKCYAKDAAYQKAVNKYGRLSEQARLDDNMDAYAKWADSLNAVTQARLKNAPAGCQVPELSSELATAARQAAEKAAAAKSGTSESALAGFTERVGGYLALSTPAERQKAVASGAYTAADAAALDKNRAALQAFMARSGSEMTGAEPDPKALAAYHADMERYETAQATYAKCTEAANAGANMPQMPPGMQAQMMNTKPPTEAQMAAAERYGKLAEAANNRGDRAKAMAYVDSAQKAVGIQPPKNGAEQQQYAKDVMAAHKKSQAAMKKCGVPPEAPIKPAYVR